MMVLFGLEPIKGISIFKNEKLETLFLESVFKQEAPINCFYKDSKGLIWVGGQNGLCSMKKNGKSYQLLITNFL
jgi:ligand-binding sensor domain-containing protein